MVKKKTIAIVDFASVIPAFNFSLLRSLRKSGYRVRYFGSNNTANSDFILSICKEADKYELRDISSSVTNRLKGGLSYLRLALSIWRDRNSIDYFLFQFPGLLVIDLLLLRCLGRRSIFLIHNAVPHDVARRAHIPTLLRAMCAGHIAAPSEYTRSQIYRSYPQLRARTISVIQHGLIPIRADDHLRPYSHEPCVSTLMYWGMVRPYKGISFLLDAAISAGRELEIHGKWAAAMEPIRKRMEETGWTYTNKFLEPEEILSLFDRNGVFILPYERASQSGIMYTFLFYGQVFLATDTGEFSHIFRAYGLEKLLFKYGDAASLEASLQWLSNNTGYVQHAFSKAQADLDWTKAVDTIDAYGRQDKPSNQTT